MTLQEIFKLTEQLQRGGVNHPILENAFAFAFCLDWEQVPIYAEFFEFAKKGLYFDDNPDINTWMVK